MNLKTIVMIKRAGSPDLNGKVGVVVATNTILGQGCPTHLCKVRIENMISDWLPREAVELLR